MVELNKLDNKAELQEETIENLRNMTLEPMQLNLNLTWLKIRRKLERLHQCSIKIN